MSSSDWSRIGKISRLTCFWRQSVWFHQDCGRVVIPFPGLGLQNISAMCAVMLSWFARTEATHFVTMMTGQAVSFLVPWTTFSSSYPDFPPGVFSSNL